MSQHSEVLVSKIKKIDLYQHEERVDNELCATGIGLDDAIPVAVLKSLPLLFLNYGGAESVRKCLQITDLTSRRGIVVEIGSGLGQPSREISWQNEHLHVIGVELIPSLATKAQELNDRCGIKRDKCEFVQGDFSKPFDCKSVAPNNIDAIVSWLAILHMTKEQRMCTWNKAFQLLKSGGWLYCEEFFTRTPFKETDKKMLLKDVYCDADELATREEYIAELSERGFKNIEFEDMTEIWSDFVADRSKQWLADKERTLRVHNTATFEGIGGFYSSMQHLFQSGQLGGVCIVARKR